MKILLLKCLLFYLIVVTNCYALTVDLDKKITATHYTGETWAPSFWSNLDIDKVANHLTKIKKNGFNSIILVVPWSGFQTSISPQIYNDKYFNQLNELIDIAKQLDIQVILRIGYAHEMGATISTPEHFERIYSFFSQPEYLSAWKAYIQRLYKITQQHNNFLFAFITWEDFSFLEITHQTLEARLILSKQTGFQTFLKKIPLKKLSAMYQQEFKDYADIPVPSSSSPAVALFYQFWDEYLIDVFTKTKAYFPALSLEVRIDCEPSNTDVTYICHEKTFNLDNQSNITVIYYHPAWGAANNYNQLSAEQAFINLQHLFKRVKQHTDNLVFIDQFNFIDNTPGFEKNSKIKQQEISHFIKKVSSFINDNSIGYGLWLMQDKKANILVNASFKNGLQGWKLKNGQLTKDNSGVYSLQLSQSASLEQTFQKGIAGHILKNMTNIVEFDLKNMTQHNSDLIVSLKNIKGEIIKEHRVSNKANKSTKIILDNFPIIQKGTLSLNNSGGNILVDNFNMYSVIQKNGIYDESGNTKAFKDDVVAMNQSLNEFEPPPSFYDKNNLDSTSIQGIYQDNWASKKIGGILSNKKALDISSTSVLSVEIYVPKKWKNYKNQVALIYNQKEIAKAKLIPGYQKINFKITADERGKSLISHFSLRAEKDFLVSDFDSTSTDIRRVSFLLLGLGFVDNPSWMEKLLAH